MGACFTIRPLVGNSFFFLGYIKMCRHAVVFFCSEVFYEHPEITKKVNLLIRLSRRRFVYLTVDPSA